MTALRNKLAAALQGSSAQNPIDTDTLAKGHHRRRVEAILVEMYEAREIRNCKIIKGGAERMVWWIAGNINKEEYGRKYQHANNNRRNKFSDATTEMLAFIKKHPGLTHGEIVTQLYKNSTGAIDSRFSNLTRSGLLRREGERRSYRYYPGARA